MTVTLKDFWAPWCGPCRVQTPIVKELEEEYKKKVKFEEINVDENIEEAGKYGVMSIPTLILEKNGAIVRQWVGVTSKEDLKEAIDEALG
ncbi:MAG: thioredoxin [Candidatus Aenigmatarchaeota archaeon]|nr:MAG: thioredoxin [Candidatus Aenigmarchaeota archaeon]